MGFLDKMKKKAQDALNQVQQATTQTQTPQTTNTHQDEPLVAAAGTTPGGPTFTWDDEIYPLIPEFQNLSAAEFFLRLEQVKDRLMHADEEPGLERMVDEDGDELDPEEVLLRTRLGFQSIAHYEGLRNWGAEKYAAEAGEDRTDYEFRMVAVARETLTGMNANAMTSAGGGSGQLDPVEGVSVEQWAQIQARLASGGDLDQLLATSGMDRAKWDRVSNEWNARMASDHTATIASVYGNAFVSSGQGQYSAQAANAVAVGTGGDLGQEPIPFERYVEIESAMGAAANRGEDAIAVLGQFGLSPIDWSNVGAFWSKRIYQQATHYAQRYHELKEHFDAKYGA